MKKVPILVLSAVFAVFSGAAAFSIDFGGLVENYSEVKGNKCNSDDMKLKQTDDVRIWLKQPLSKDGTSYIATEGMYKYTYDYGTEKTRNILDLSLFKLAVSASVGESNLFSVSLGRFNVSDASGNVFNQYSDGARISFKMSRATISAYGGYTGLTNAESITMLKGEKSQFTYDSDKLYDTNVKYIPYSLTITAPYLFLNQTFTVEGWGFSDISGDDTTYSKYYGTASIGGPLAGTVYYTVSSTFGKIEHEDDICNMTKADIAVYPSFLSSSLKLRGLYASGKQGPFSAFKGVTSRTATLALNEPEYTGMILYGISTSIKPVKQVILSAGGDVVLAYPEDDIKYDGFQWIANATWQVVTDLQLSAGAYQYNADDTARSKTSFSLRAVLSF